MSLVLRILSLICFILAAIGIGAPVDLIAAGLAFWVGSTLTDGR